MRVVGGIAKGRALQSVPGDSTRPILDRVKTALFDVLRPELSGMQVLDLFAGSGSVGIEALSQGAAHCTFLDTERRAIDTIRENLAHTGLHDRAEVRHTDAFTYLRNAAKVFDLMYVAPPQYRGMWLDAVRFIAERPELLSTEGIVVIQIDPKESEPLLLTAFKEEKRKQYGNTELIFLRRSESAPRS